MILVVTKNTEKMDNPRHAYHQTYRHWTSHFVWGCLMFSFHQAFLCVLRTYRSKKPNHHLPYGSHHLTIWSHANQHFPSHFQNRQAKKNRWRKAQGGLIDSCWMLDGVKARLWSKWLGSGSLRNGATITYQCYKVVPFPVLNGVAIPVNGLITTYRTLFQWSHYLTYNW